MLSNLLLVVKIQTGLCVFSHPYFLAFSTSLSHWPCHLVIFGPLNQGIRRLVVRYFGFLKVSLKKNKNPGHENQWAAECVKLICITSLVAPDLRRINLRQR